MKRIYPFALCVSLIGLTACSDDDDATVVEPVEPEMSYIRVIHAGSDAPLVNVVANGNALLSNVDYAMASDLIEVSATSYDIDVDAVLADGSTLTVLEALLDAQDDMEYTAIALGSVADNTLSLKLIENPTMDIAAGYARVQVLHGAPLVGTVDIYVTAPDADISATAPTLSASYLDVSTQIEVPASDYQIRITASGMKDVVYDSGSVALGDMQDYFISAIPNTWSGDSPVALQVSLPGSQLVLNDVNSGADLRVVHAVADAPAVDVFVDGAATPAVDMLSFGDVTGYLNLAEGAHTVTVAADADNDVVVIDNAAVDLGIGMSYSALAVGSLTSNMIEPLVLVEQTRRVATEAKLTVTHAAYSAPEVDVYLTSSADISDATPVLEDVPFKVSSGSLSVPPGTYTISVTVANTKDVAIGPLEVTLGASGIYGVAAVDNVGGGAPFGVILLDDFTAM
jgi:hypothetical protein